MFEKWRCGHSGSIAQYMNVEVLASVDFIRHNNPGISLEDTIAAIHNWSERKNKLFKNEYEADPKGLVSFLYRVS